MDTTQLQNAAPSSIHTNELTIGKMGAWGPAANYGAHIELGGREG